MTRSSSFQAPRDAIVRCEAMVAFAATARDAVEVDDRAELGHAIEGMKLTISDLEKYRDRTADEDIEEDGHRRSVPASAGRRSLTCRSTA